MNLFDYMKDLQRLIRDQNQTYINPDDLIRYINESRRQVALRTKCVRILSPISGQVVSASITAAGSGYVNPIATISAPDFPSAKGLLPNGAQATATCQALGGVISNINITYGGAGYYTPTITITDGANNTGPGTGATATVSTSPVMQTSNNQEVYNFSDVPLQEFPGVGQVIWVNSVSIIFAQYRYQLMTYSFGVYQALIRNYPLQYKYVPSVCSQFGQGANGSLYLYPVASQGYQLEWDCICEPLDLIDDGSYEAIPSPWQDCVKWYAAHLCFLELQNLNAAEYYRKMADEKISAYSTWARPSKVPNRYGRWTVLPPLMMAAHGALHYFAGLLT